MRKVQEPRLGSGEELGEFEVQEVLEWREGRGEVRKVVAPRARPGG